MLNKWKKQQQKNKKKKMEDQMLYTLMHAET